MLLNSMYDIISFLEDNEKDVITIECNINGDDSIVKNTKYGESYKLLR